MSLISCDCSIDDYYGDSPEYYQSKIIKARKTHKCCECKEDIKPGQQYYYYKGKWEDGIGIYRTCIPCYKIGKYYCPDGYIIGRLVEQISECLGFDYRNNDTIKRY